MLVSLDDVKRVLRVDGDHDDWEIQKIADAASDIVMGYLKKPLDTYTQDTLPPRIDRAILEVCVRLFDDRDGEKGLQGPEGRPGRDVTQLGGDGSKW